MPRPKPTPESTSQAFAAKYIVLEAGCWEWQGCKNPKGYGLFHNGVRTGAAHRYAYEQKYGRIPAGLVIDHLCRNHACVNPDHLQPVTNKENLRRGISANAVKTHCKHGHAYTLSNTLTDARGRRRCRTCVYADNLRRHHARKGATHGAA